MGARTEDRRGAVAGRAWVAPAILAGLVLLSFGTSLNGGFVWDDRPLILDNPMVTEPGHWTELATSSFWDTGETHDRFRAFFRPVVSLTYALEYRIWGLVPFGFHLTNLVAHYLCCLLIFRLAIGEGLSAWSALGAAALFAVHPVHVESVAWISGRTDLLCGLLLLTAFTLHRGNARSRWEFRREFGMLAFFSLALLAKEMAATFPLILFVDRWLDSPAGKRLRSAVRATGPSLIVLGLYLIWRAQVLDAPDGPLFQLSPVSFVATAAFVLARYLTLLIAPMGLDAHYPYQAFQTLLNPAVWISILMMSIVLVAGYLARHSRQVLFWLSWIFISLMPVLLFGRFGDVLMADRFLYIPSVGLAMLAARALSQAELTSRTPRRLAAAVTMGILLMLSLVSFTRAQVWKDDLTLFSDMAQTSPASALVRCNLGRALYSRGRIDESIEEFAAAIAVEPGHAMAYNNLGAALEYLGDWQRALEHYDIALELAPQLLEAEANRAHLLALTGREEKGIRRLRELIVAHPDSIDLRLALADGLRRNGDTGGALDQLRLAWNQDPSHLQTRYMLGVVHDAQGDRHEAARWMRLVRDTVPVDDPRNRHARRVIAAAEAYR